MPCTTTSTRSRRATRSTGPFPGFPVALEGDDVSELIEKHRDELPFSDQLPTMDPPMHKAHRGLLMRLITPKRLKENEEFMWRLADRQIDEFVGRGRCELVRDFAGPFTLLVIADLLGVPEEDRPIFREELQGSHRDQALGSTEDDKMAHSPLEYLYSQIRTYVEDRRRSPRDDVITGLATATFPDGSLPDVMDVVRVAANLFAAGQETTVRLLGSALQRIAEDDDLQQLLRNEPDHIPNFVEETLRFESPVKGDFRLSRVPTTVGGVDIACGNDGDGDERRCEPRSTALRLADEVRRRPRQRPRTSRLRPRRCTSVRARRWPGPRPASRSSACSTGCTTSGSTRTSTARRMLAGTSTRRLTSCAGLNRLHLTFTPA